MLLDSLLGTRPISANALPGPLDPYWYSPVGQRSTSGVRVSEDTALNYSAVWCATWMICGTISRLRKVLMHEIGDDVHERAKKHPVYKILYRKPNICMTAMGFWSTETAAQVNWGNAFAEIERDGRGKPLATWPIHPSRLPAKNVFQHSDGSLTYYVKNEPGVDPTPIEGADMLHIPGVHSQDGVFGKGVIRYARESIGMGTATEQYGAGFFGNGARPGGVLKHKKTLSEQAQIKLRMNWNQVHQGPGNSNNIAILEEEMDYQQVGIPPEAAQFLQTREFNITEMARWYMIPPHKLAQMMKIAYGNLEDSGRDFIQSLLWWMELQEQEIARKLLTEDEQDSYSVEHDLKGLLKGNSEARAAYYNTLFGMGAFSTNDVRREERLNPVGPNGDKRFVSANVVSLERAGEQPIDMMGGQQPRTKPKLPNKNNLKKTKQPAGSDDDTANALAESVRITRMNRQIEAANRMARQVVARFATKEANEAKRFAKQSPEAFGTRLMEFYSKHGDDFCIELEPAADAYLSATGRSDELHEFVSAAAQRYVAESKMTLAGIAESTAPGELHAAITAAVSKWAETRINFTFGE